MAKPLETMQQQISVTTKGYGDMHDITDQVATAVGESGVMTGVVNVFNVGSTAAIGTIEFEPGLRADMPAILDKLIPPSRNYGHEQAWHDGNGHSHLQAAESARGVSPRAAHRSGRESLDSSGSCHPPKAAAFCQGKEFLRLPVDSNSTWMTCPLRSVGVTPLLHYYETVRPCLADQYFRPRGAAACAFSLSTADRFSSSVPEPGIESRHLCTGHHMASKQISAMLIPRAEGTLRFRCRLLIRFDAFSVVHLRSSLYSSHDVIYSRLLTMTFTTAAFDRSSSWLFEACFCKPASKGLPSSPAQHHALTSVFLTQPLHGPGRALVSASGSYLG